MKKPSVKKAGVFSLVLGAVVCLLVTAAITVYYAGKYPECRLRFEDLLEKAQFVNYSIQEDNKLLSTSADPMIIIPLEDDKNDVKALWIDIEETSGNDAYWVEVFLYDDTEWVISDFWVQTGGTSFNNCRRTDNFKYLRLDLCNVEQVSMLLKSITINPLRVFLCFGFTAGFFAGACACFAAFLICQKINRRLSPAKARKRPAPVQSCPDKSIRWLPEAHRKTARSCVPLIQNHFIRLSDWLLCAVLALAFAAAPSCIKDGSLRLRLPFLLSVCFYFAVFLYLASAIRTAMASGKGCSIPGSPALEAIINRRNGIIRVGALIFLCWLPVLFLLYPGTCFFDTLSELGEYGNYIWNNGHLHDHHPFFDTLLMGSLIVPASRATGKWHVVLFCYVLLQSIAASLSFSYVLHYAYRKLNIGINAVFAAFLLYCFLPHFPLSVQTIGKDSISAWIFVLYTVLLMETVRTNGQSLKNRRFLFAFILLGTALSLTKKINIYICLASIILVFIFEKKARKAMLASLLCLLVVFYAVLPCVRVTLNVRPGGKQEMFSLPFQMTARYVRDYPDSMTDEEATIIDKVLTIDDLAERYNPVYADPVKGWTQKGNTRDYLSYIKVWFLQGFRHPDAYIHAGCSMLAGWFSWYPYLPQMDMNHHPDLTEGIIPEWVPYRGWSLSSAESMKEFYDSLYQIPLVSVLSSFGFYASILPAFIAATVCCRRKKQDIQYWLAVVPMMLTLILGCWLAPCSINVEGGVRYLYPVIYTIPLLLMWCLYIYRREGKA